MKNIIFILCLLIVIANKAQAQILLGLQIGLSSNYLKTNIANRPSTTINSQTGYTIGLPFQYGLKYWLYFQALPNITQKNYTVSRTGSLQGVYQQNNNTYLQLPVSLHVIYGKRLQVFANAGGYIGYWAGGRTKGKAPNIFAVTDTVNATGQQTENFQLTAYNQKYDFNNLRDRRLELGWVVGVGLQYKPQKNYTVFIECNYYQSLTDQQKAYMINQIAQYTQTFTLSVGCLYPLKCHRPKQ